VVLQQYRKRKRTSVTAVQLDLDTKGFEYKKWGGVQRCKQGDWLVNNQGDVYTIDAGTFQVTYRQLSPGVYEKSAPVWAEQADRGGVIQTKEGSTAYEVGDYLVYNDPGRKDGYAVKSAAFHSMYEPFEG
jgi:hypothetical protein